MTFGTYVLILYACIRNHDNAMVCSKNRYTRTEYGARELCAAHADKYVRQLADAARKKWFLITAECVKGSEA